VVVGWICCQSYLALGSGAEDSLCVGEEVKASTYVEEGWSFHGGWNG
jgi:hypothetical protein